MKRIYVKHTAIALLLVSALWSCQKIEVDLSSKLTSDNFPLTESQFNSVTGTVYTNLRGSFAGDYFMTQTLGSNEAIMPAFGGNWFDGGRFMQLHKHTWTKDHALLGGLWGYITNLIGTSNQIIYIVNTAPESAAKQTALAEVKMVRALAYYLFMDNFGNVPIDTVYGSTELHTNTPRAQVFDFVEKEIKKSLPYLKRTSGSAMYGRPNVYMAYALLAKMYLNAEVYTGTQRNNDCIMACDSVINAGGGSLYSLESRSTYLQMFYPTNGPSLKEFIFVIPYDPTFSSNYLFYARYDLNRNLGIRYKYSGSTSGNVTNPIMNASYPNSGLVNSKPSGPRSVLPEYYAYFYDANDIRNNQWLTGLQYWPDGSPIMVKTTKAGYDAAYPYANISDSAKLVYTYHLNLTPGVQFRTGVSGVNINNFDVGNDEIAWNMGYRNIKFYPDYTNTTSRNQNNDAPVFRYSDIILMKAEAILRGGTPTLGHTALSLANQLRAVRTTSPAWGNITLDSIYNERCREFAWEACHRIDMIRFGKFENSYGYKTDANTYKRIFPIPQDALSVNGNLVQNPGY